MKKKSTVSINADHFAPFIAAKEELDKKIKAEGLIAVKAFLKEYFEKSPEVYGVKWAQYTPYFNDGEACVFHLGSVAVYPTKEEFEGDDSLYDFESYGEEPETSLNQIEDILEAIFGDHVQISATREEITTEEYEHE
jgi:hypothetical protein